MRRFVMVAALVLAAATWACGAQIVIDFTEPTSKATSIFVDNMQSNMGGHAQQWIGGAGSAWNPAYALYYFDVSALAGATIDCATFHAHETWWSADISGVEVHRMNAPVMWERGNGLSSNRWGSPDNGLGVTMADWNTATQTGFGWDGVAKTALSWGDPDVTTAMGAEVIDNQPVLMGGTPVWNITSLVQNWANGTWSNKGFILYPGASANTDQLSSPSVTIDYTAGAIPEPATMVLVGTGIAAFVGFARRRRK